MNKNRTVTQTELQVIQKTAADVSVHPYIRRRALILQELSTGASTLQVCNKLGLSKQLVTRIGTEYSKKKLGTLTNTQYSSIKVITPKFKHVTGVVTAKSITNRITKHKQ